MTTDAICEEHRLVSQARPTSAPDPLAEVGLACETKHRSDWSHQVSVMVTTWWLQCDQTLSLWRVWFARLWVMWKTSPSPTHTRTRTHMLMGLFKINHMISFIPRLVPAYDTQNCRVVARPLFSFPSLSVHTGRNKMQCESRAIQILHKIQYQQNYSGVLLISHTNEEFWSWTVRRSLQTLYTKQLQKEWTQNITLNRVILIFSPSPTHKLYKIKTKGVETN